jgi:hypothetical protein
MAVPRPAAAPRRRHRHRACARGTGRKPALSDPAAHWPTMSALDAEVMLRT